MPKHYPNTQKIIMVGDSGVGKSNILMRYAYDKFTESFMPTIGIDLFIKQMLIDEKKYRVQIWDTAGQERYRTIVSAYYRNIDGILLVYDITERKSFVNLKHWLKEIETNSNNNKRQIIIVGNKIDMKDNREVSREEAEQFAEEKGFDYFEVSPKENINIAIIYEKLVAKIIFVKQDQDLSEPEIQINHKKKQNNSCC